MSGTSWKDALPEGWGTTPLKRLVQPTRPITYGIVQCGPDVEGGIPYIRPVDMDDEGGLAAASLQRTALEIAAAYERSRIAPGDLVVSIGPSFGKVMTVPRELDGANLTQGTARVAPSTLVDGRYLFWALRSREVRDAWDAECSGATFRALTLEILREGSIPLPPREVQRGIASFLDRETARIDTVIENKRRLLDLLEEKRTALITRAVTQGLDPDVPMKDSGVEWIGEIPEHWNVLPIYAAFYAQLGKMLDAKRITGEHLAPYLRNQDVQWRSINTEDLPMMDFDGADRKRYSLRPGDLLVCEGGDIGRSAIWRGEIQECYYQKALHRVRGRGAHSTEFLFYAMRAAAHLGVFEAGGNPNTIIHLTATMLRHYRFPMPGPEEQRQIVAELDRHWARTERLKTRITRAISLMQEFRTASISTAVTGEVIGRHNRPRASEAMGRKTPAGS